jgi:4-azaleucine resistance transporter AzlC
VEIERATQPDWWPEFRSGFLAAVPIWLGAAPFGAIYAVTALSGGLSPAQTLAMSLFVFAGAAQFTAAGLFVAGVTPLAIVITTLIVNARHVLLSASIAPHLRTAPGWLRGLLLGQLTDETYALGMRRFIEGDASPTFLLGANLSLYLAWQTSTILGMLLGALIPDPAALGLDLVFPLTFIGLLAPILRSRIDIIVFAGSVIVSLAGALLLPGKWYILLAGVVASGLGAFLETRRRGAGETGR